MRRVVFAGPVGLLGVVLSAFASTVVGHPVPGQVAAGAGLVFQSGVMEVSTIVYDHCAEADETVAFDEVLDPVAGDTIVLTPGPQCNLRVYLADRLDLSGTGPSNSTFDLSLGVGWIDLTFDPPITVPSSGASGGTAYELAFEDWVTASMLGLDPNEHVVVGANHALHTSLRNAVRNGSTLW